MEANKTPGNADIEALTEEGARRLLDTLVERGVIPCYELDALGKLINPFAVREVPRAIGGPAGTGRAGKKLAKLNPKNVRFDVGVGGGEPDLISTDFAAAVAWMPKGLGRELLCRAWWPAGSEMTDAQVLSAIRLAQLTEWKRREDAMGDAMMIVATQGGSAGERAYGIAHARRWPGITETTHGVEREDVRYPGVCKAALRELMESDVCKTCHGYGEFEDADSSTFECADCIGTGRKAKTDGWRANASGINRGSYVREGWDRAYTWTLGHVRSVLSGAEKKYDELTD